MTINCTNRADCFNVTTTHGGRITPIHSGTINSSIRSWMLAFRPFVVHSLFCATKGSGEANF